MPISDNLMGMGLPGSLAATLGNDPKTVAGAGTTQATATAVYTHNTEITTGSGATGVRIPTNRSIGSLWYFFNSTATSAIVYAPTGDNLNGAASTTGLTVALNKGALLWQYKKNNWASVLTA